MGGGQGVEGGCVVTLIMRMSRCLRHTRVRVGVERVGGHEGGANVVFKLNARHLLETSLLCFVLKGSFANETCEFIG